MSKLTTARSTPAVKLRMKCSRSRNFSANSPPAKVDKNVASDSNTALMNLFGNGRTGAGYIASIIR